MKRFILMLIMALVGGMVMAQGAEVVQDQSFWEILKENIGTVIWGLIGFITVIVRLTPTKRDDEILNWIIKILNVIIPNRKEGGGTHKF